MVGYAGSPACIVHADVTLARSHGDDCQPPSGPLFVCLCVVVYSVCSDGVCNTIEENSSIFSLIEMC